MHAETRKKILSNIPNFITAARIVGTVCLLFIPALSPAFFIIYTLSGFTDVLDGWLARKTGTAGELGAMLDSIADLLYYAVMLLKIMPILVERLPLPFWWVVGFVLVLRLSAYIAAAVKFKRFASIHTYLNKVTGLAIFTVPYWLATPVFVPVCWTICVIAAIGSGEELLMHLLSKTYRADRKTILGRK